MQTDVNLKARTLSKVRQARIGGIKTVQPGLFPYERPQPTLHVAPQEKNGVVYTKPWVVDLILDLVGYTAERPLYECLLIEPAAGDGSFLLHVAARLVESCARHSVPLTACRSSVLAFELDERSADRARSTLRRALVGHGATVGDATLLSNDWVRAGDYLMETGHLAGKADFVVGNPPYIRLEDLENGGELYRSAYPTMVGRADIYVAFYEAALRHLKVGGACGFICADRWMFNQYGAELRSFITRQFSVEAVIQMHHADAFEKEVSAYPAVTIIRNGKQGPVVVANLDPEAERIGATALAAEFVHDKGVKGSTNAARIDRWFTGDAPWPLMEPHRLALLRRLEAEFPTLEGTGTTVGIGVATGADKVFITKDAQLVEADRLLPLAMAADAKGAAVKWSRHYLVNPWNGVSLVNLADYPRLAAYFGEHRDQLQGRHVGKKAPANWYRTIDRVNAQLTSAPKLYFPDFKGRIAPVLDRGETYPHHNLYFVTSEKWDLEVLGGLLLTDVAQFFIEAYGVRMRGGYLRFQAQYLRRIRVPGPAEISHVQAEGLRCAFEMHDVVAANAIADELYHLTTTERKLLGHTS